MDKSSQAQRERFERELAEFFDKYPQADPDDIPQSVWEKVKEGQSLTEAYEAYAKNNEQRKKIAYDINEKNKDTSPGKINGRGKSGYYTAKQVAAMTDAQVRENYTAILESMSAPGFYD